MLWLPYNKCLPAFYLLGFLFLKAYTSFYRYFFQIYSEFNKLYLGVRYFTVTAIIYIRCRITKLFYFNMVATSFIIKTCIIILFMLFHIQRWCLIMMMSAFFLYFSLYSIAYSLMIYGLYAFALDFFIV